jgi:NAD(P)-dependent dehydrogenase (short-subunit alcohol dehydrogenase family)
LAASLAPAGVTANALAPGLIDTEMVQGDAEVRRRKALATPMRRMGLPDEIARVALAVLETGFITGQTLVIDGGVRPG